MGVTTATGGAVGGAATLGGTSGPIVGGVVGSSGAGLTYVVTGMTEQATTGRVPDGGSAAIALAGGGFFGVLGGAGPAPTALRPSVRIATPSPLLRWSQSPTVQQNRTTGNAAADHVAEQLRDAGFSIAGREVSVGTPFGLRRADIVLEINGRFHGIEVKSGCARRSTEQFAKDRWIDLYGGAAVGPKAKELGIDAIETMTTIHRP